MIKPFPRNPASGNPGFRLLHSKRELPENLVFKLSFLDLYTTQDGAGLNK